MPICKFSLQMYSASDKISDACMNVSECIRHIGRGIYVQYRIRAGRRDYSQRETSGTRRTPRKCKWNPSVGVSPWYDTCQMWELNGHAREWDLINGRRRPCTLMNFLLADVGSSSEEHIPLEIIEQPTRPIKQQTSHFHYLRKAVLNFSSISLFLDWSDLEKCLTFLLNCILEIITL